MRLVAIDPGCEKSGWVQVATDEGYANVERWGIDRNEELIGNLSLWAADLLAIEYFRTRGMPIAQQEIDTVFESGRMIQAWGRDWIPVPRKDVKISICGTMKAKDSNIRRALIDMFGGDEVTKKNGALYGLKSHCWQALGVAITALGSLAEQEQKNDS